MCPAWICRQTCKIRRGSFVDFCRTWAAESASTTTSSGPAIGTRPSRWIVSESFFKFPQLSLLKSNVKIENSHNFEDQSLCRRGWITTLWTGWTRCFGGRIHSWRLPFSCPPFDCSNIWIPSLEPQPVPNLQIIKVSSFKKHLYWWMTRRIPQDVRFLQGFWNFSQFICFLFWLKKSFWGSPLSRIEVYSILLFSGA